MMTEGLDDNRNLEVLPPIRGQGRVRYRDIRIGAPRNNIFIHPTKSKRMPSREKRYLRTHQLQQLLPDRVAESFLVAWLVDT